MLQNPSVISGYQYDDRTVESLAPPLHQNGGTAKQYEDATAVYRTRNNSYDNVLVLGAPKAAESATSDPLYPQDRCQEQLRLIVRIVHWSDTAHVRKRRQGQNPVAALCVFLAKLLQLELQTSSK